MKILRVITYNLEAFQVQISVEEWHRDNPQNGVHSSPLK